MERSIIICGLPDAGKTTFLAALWHLISSEETETALKLHTMKASDLAHLNTLVVRWRRGQVQVRTETGANPPITVKLKDSNDATVRLTFPDLSGESYQRMWSDRDCDNTIAELANTGEGFLLFVNANKLKKARWIVEDISLSEQLALIAEHSDTEPTDEQPVEWDAKQHSPTQVQLVDVLQMFRMAPLDKGPRKLVLMLSVWDKVEPEGLNPEGFLSMHMPLLNQYLRYGLDEWTWKIYGVSAQGGDYEAEDIELTDEQIGKLEELRAKDLASTRIRLISNNGESHDLTEPIEWLMS